MKPAGILPDVAGSSSSTDRDPAIATPPESGRARIVLLGASGYAGQEFLRLSLQHPHLEVVGLISRDPSSDAAAALLPGVDRKSRALPPILPMSEIGGLVGGGACDTIVTSLPHGAWGPIEDDLDVDLSGVRIVDLSADHRDGSMGYVYGLPEAFRNSIAAAQRVANPGCYPTAAALALLPAAESGWIGGPVTITALSGVSGAGRSAALRTSFVEVDGGASFYKVGTVHPHVVEMERTVHLVSGGHVPVFFAPQLVPMSRGILLTANVPLAKPVEPAEARAAYEARYANEPFVRLLPENAWPETRLVKGSNRCDVQVTTAHGGRLLVACAAIDNLVKGAAGQAIQNLNIMLGLPEATGLPMDGLPW